jgi:RNA polymerase sigma-70 factor (sigma-E family)
MTVEDFDVAFDRLLPRAERMASRLLGDPFEAQDVAAEALTRAFARWPSLGGADHRDGWVLRVAANLCIDRLRRKPPGLTEVMATDANDATLLRMALVEALRALPRRQRQVIVLRYFSDLSETEVAAALKVRVGTVKTHHHRALRALQERLGERTDEGLRYGHD